MGCGGTGGAGTTLTLTLLSGLQKRNRAITARRQHLKVGAGRGVVGWNGVAGQQT